MGQVLMNCNVTSECAYKEKSKNFHSFSDENGNRYGLGFHKSESGLKQAAHFLKSVIAVIDACKNREIEEIHVPPQPPPQPPQQNDNYSQSVQSQPGGMPPPNPYQQSIESQNDQFQQNEQYEQNENEYQQNQSKQAQPPPLFSQQNNDNNGY